MIPTNNFWDVNIGNVVGTVALLVSFWAAHHANVKRIQMETATLQDPKTKMDLIYRWFSNNVIGRGESQRGAPYDDKE